ncbi:hypothetical protein [Nocardia sp. NPDC049707]|uniref:hypothetical protein n=1 Tax=Nocardia sp. NPDC049707 TaxID=3154735 RepID=UPI00343D519C
MAEDVSAWQAGFDEAFARVAVYSIRRSRGVGGSVFIEPLLEKKIKTGGQDGYSAAGMPAEAITRLPGL